MLPLFSGKQKHAYVSISDGIGPNEKIQYCASTVLTSRHI